MRFRKMFTMKNQKRLKGLFRTLLGVKTGHVGKLWFPLKRGMSGLNIVVGFYKPAFNLYFLGVIHSKLGLFLQLHGQGYWQLF
jgi:hypothetical protein